MPQVLTLRIVIEQLPAGVDFALQRGSGSTYKPVQNQRSNGNDIGFEFQPSIKDGVSDTVCTGAATTPQRTARAEVHQRLSELLGKCCEMLTERPANRLGNRP